MPIVTRIPDDETIDTLIGTAPTTSLENLAMTLREFIAEFIKLNSIVNSYNTRINQITIDNQRITNDIANINAVSGNIHLPTDEHFTMSAGETGISLAHVPFGGILLFYNEAQQIPGDAYTMTDNVVSLTFEAVDNAKVDVYYSYIA